MIEQFTAAGFTHFTPIPGYHHGMYRRRGLLIVPMMHGDTLKFSVTIDGGNGAWTDTPDDALALAEQLDARKSELAERVKADLAATGLSWDDRTSTEVECMIGDCTIRVVLPDRPHDCYGVFIFAPDCPEDSIAHGRDRDLRAAIQEALCDVADAIAQLAIVADKLQPT